MIQTVNRSGTPDLEVKSPAISWQRHGNAKVQEDQDRTLHSSQIAVMTSFLQQPSDYLGSSSDASAISLYKA
jgi:hypothetical protein